MIRGPTRIFLRVLVHLMVLVAVVLGLGAWRLAQGPLSVAWLLPWLEQGMSDTASGQIVDLADVQIIWDRHDLDVALELTDLALSSAAGKPILRLPMARIRLSPHALWQGILAPTAITVEGLTVEIRRNEDGSVVVGVDPPTGTAPASENDAPDWRTVLAEGLADGGRGRGPSAYLRQVILRQGSLRLDDRMTGRVWRASDVDLAIRRGPQGPELGARLDLDLAGQVTRLTTNAVWRVGPATADLPVGGSVEARFDVVNLRPSALIDLVPKHRDSLGALQLAIAAKGEILIDLAKGPQRAAVTLSASNGQLVDRRLVGGVLPIAALDTQLTWSADAGGQVDLANLTMRLEQGEVIAATASVRAMTEATRISGDVQLTNVTLDRLPKLWPAEVAPNPREWVTGNLSQGRVSEAKMRFDLSRARAGAEILPGRIDGHIDFQGVRSTYFGKLPAAEKIDGRAVFDATRMDVKIASASVRSTKIRHGDIAITGFDQPLQHIAIDLDLTGPVSDALTIINQPPLGYLKRLGIAPQAVAGDSQVHLHFAFPLLQALRLDDVQIAVTGEVKGGKLPKVVRDYDLTEANLTLKLDGKGLEMAGTGKVADIPAQLRWIELFEDKVKFRRRIEASGMVSDQDRRRVNLAFDPYLLGPMAMEVAYTEYPDRSELTGSAKLDTATVQFEDLGWVKPPGVAGNGQFQITLKKGELQTLDSLILDTRAPAADQPPLKASLAGRFEGGSLTQMRIHSFLLGPTNISGDVRFRAKGGYDADLRGDSVDARTLLAEWLKNDGPVDPRPRRSPFALRGQFARVVLGEGRAMSQARIAINHDGLRAASLDLSGRVAMAGKSGALSVTIAPAAGGRSLDVRTDNAGVVLKALDLTDYILNGQMHLTGRYEDRPERDRLIGQATMSDYRIVGMPVLAQLLAFASITGIPEMMTGEGVAFHTLKVDFARDDAAMEISEGRAAGLALGINFRGRIRQPGSIAELSGTVVPVYAVNQVLGAIPLLGDILTGGRGGGIFAWTYRVTGPLDKPDVSVNPLSALAPGFLRNLFDDSTPGKPPAPTPPRPENAP